MTVLAHQGGWDEMLLVVGPILAIIGLLRLAKKRSAAAAPAVGSALGSAAGRTDQEVEAGEEVDGDAHLPDPVVDHGPEAR